jgi:GNAT superfamily N-acetyltransferase
MAHVIRIIRARASDAGLIVHFVRALAAYEKEPAQTVRITEADVVRDGFGANPRFEALIAEMDGAPAGFALFFPNYSTWEGRPGLYVEDIFVEEHARRHGVGRRLMAAVARLARERGFARIDLSMLDWNPARGFYRRLGLKQMESWQPFRLEGVSLERLAMQSGADDELTPDES